jgi:hypothetical protein
MENKMAERDTSRNNDVATAQPSECKTSQNPDLQALLQELERPLDQSVVDHGLLRLATFVAGRH